MFTLCCMYSSIISMESEWANSKLLESRFVWIGCDQMVWGWRVFFSRPDVMSIFVRAVPFRHPTMCWWALFRSCGVGGTAFTMYQMSLPVTTVVIRGYESVEESKCSFMHPTVCPTKLFSVRRDLGWCQHRRLDACFSTWRFPPYASINVRRGWEYELSH